ncbi:urea carboxylase-related aminomethyltransferase [Vibrio astriarenae]|nr:urea carboxylase-related aminomethyltransferase [Vibrio sp. C7]
MIVESQLQPSEALYRDIVPAGDYYMKVVKKGQTFRILDIEGNQAADTLFTTLTTHQSATAPSIPFASRVTST